MKALKSIANLVMHKEEAWNKTCAFAFFFKNPQAFMIFIRRYLSLSLPNLRHRENKCIISC